MDIKRVIIYSIASGFILLSFSCRKIINSTCTKEGYVFLDSQSRCWYSPSSDSLLLGGTITLEASIPRTFIDENTNTTVTNSSSFIIGPLGIGMIYPIYQAAVDSFELSAEIGKIIKDTINFSEGMLKGFRTIQWDGTSVDSFKMKINIKPLAKGIYAFALNQQGYKDKDCALYKYFLKPGNVNQHLDYWMDVFGNVSEEVTFSTYCVKIY